jgi:endonuclease/exonuclease/phosphatase (EEP) superfamily protein YafD
VKTWPGRVLAALAAGWLLFTLLQALLTDRWWWPVGDLVPPLAFLAVPLVLLAGAASAALVSRTRTALSGWAAAAAVVALALGLGRAGLNLDAIGGRAAVPAGALHVVSWNTEYWDQNDDPARFYAYLRARHADVYLLQEYLNWDSGDAAQPARQVDDLARLRAAFPGYAIAVRGELLTLSRFPIVAEPPVGPDRELAGQAATPWLAVFDTAKVLRTDLRVGSGVASVYNVHLPVQIDVTRSPLTAGFYGFARQAEGQRQAQLRGLEADVRANRQPLLIAGDFNTSPAMGDLRGLRSLVRDAAGSGTALYPASWQAGAWPSLWRLDWAFTGNQLRAYRMAFLDPQGMSDHRLQDLLVSP